MTGEHLEHENPDEAATVDGSAGKVESSNLDDLDKHYRRTAAASKFEGDLHDQYRHDFRALADHEDEVADCDGHDTDEEEEALLLLFALGAFDE